VSVIAVATDDAPVNLAAIRDHYDRLSRFYRALWGEHIHHGYFERGDESPGSAQLKLVEQLASRVHILRGARVLDVGCGLGGSSLWLARNFGCRVLGLTISPVQAAMAAERASAERLQDCVDFQVKDANYLDLTTESFDIVWVIECTEHLRDKSRFIESCARVLKPGGTLAICAWVAAECPRSGEHARLLSAVCTGMLCPSLGSQREYLRWISTSGFAQVRADEITRQVEQTWEHSARIAARPEVQAALLLGDVRMRRFVRAFSTIRRAYAEGAMAYGIFTARKSARSGHRSPPAF
jgi:tocopherol O-methyltransferase